MPDHQEILDLAPGASPEQRVRWTFWILPTTLVIMLVALVATSVLLVRDRREAPTVETAVQPADLASSVVTGTPAERALATARLAASTYFTLDHTSVEADMDRFRELGTPAFVEEYDQMAGALAQRISDERLRLSASLPANGVATEYLSQDVAQVLVSVDVTTRRGPKSTTAGYRTRVLLEWADAQWRVAALDEVR